MGLAPPSPWHLLVLVSISSLLFTAGRSQTAAPAPSPRPSSPAPPTDPIEDAAVKSVFRKLKVPMSWNTSSDPCTGHAIDDSKFDDERFGELIRCECYTGVCHVTQVKIFAKSATGPIPEELQNLTNLFNLNMEHNYLTGPLPSFIGKLTKMKWMNFAFNALTGTIPKEIGNLQDLRVLGLAFNNFSGTLPPELGNLINLEKLHMHSSGVGGDIPPTISNLQKLANLWISDNNFTGKIPDFIGELKNLLDLRLQGTSLQGPIPSSFVNLTKLDTLMIGDITSGSSSMDFTKDMKTLTTLVLRNAKISGIIPLSIGEVATLEHLDLSFNNLSGSLPAFLFKMSKLRFLLLGNNSFSGGLPQAKDGPIRTIDISYNNLEGDIPSWVSEQGLELNLVANNFATNSFSNRGLKQGLECLQKTIPCFHGSPRWSSFAINCGGSEVNSASDQLVYEQDTDNFTGASYYVSPETKWAVSNVGVFQESPSAVTYTELSLAQSTNTLDPELFKSARVSPSSLRYYGLGLENGIYTVKLQFAELKFPDPPDWISVGRRVFDIYVQGNLVETDFDIRKETGGRSYVALVKNFTAKVTENFLEIHLFWAGKGSCCIPVDGYHGPLISAIAVNPNFVPTVTNQPPGTKSSKKSHAAMIAGVVVLVVTLSCLLASGIFMWKKKRKYADDGELVGLDVKSEIFSYAELKEATDDFNPANKLGEGGFGVVYKGTLHDGRTVAVKKLSATSTRGKQQFLAEIGTITTVLHRNLVKLYGCCFQGNTGLLVYEYLENKSLDQALFGTKGPHLNWQARFNICLGTARGLAYLHEESTSRIVHRDVKASNILLDGDLHPKISDFGLAKLFDDKKSHISTGVAGTIGYLAPEYALRGHLTEKADVYSFGVVALEIVSGRRNANTYFNEEMMYLIDWVWHLHENNLHQELVDPNLESYDQEEALRMIKVALICIQSSPMLRPPMTKVVSMLAGDIMISEITSKPAYLTDWNFKDVTTGSYATSDFSSASVSLRRSKRMGISSSERRLTDPLPSPKDTQAMLQDLEDGR